MVEWSIEDRATLRWLVSKLDQGACRAAGRGESNVHVHATLADARPAVERLARICREFARIDEAVDASPEAPRRPSPDEGEGEGVHRAASAEATPLARLALAVAVELNDATQAGPGADWLGWQYQPVVLRSSEDPGQRAGLVLFESGLPSSLDLRVRVTWDVYALLVDWPGGGAAVEPPVDVRALLSAAVVRHLEARRGAAEAPALKAAGDAAAWLSKRARARRDAAGLL